MGSNQYRKDITPYGGEILGGNKPQATISKPQETVTTGGSSHTGYQTHTPDALKAYGIDWSPEQTQQIANIFRDSATAAYNTAQNQYSNEMASQQATLSDTIRRSQAQAIATGASRGMQAANELSAMLGLQQAAAEGATSMQGTYAEALANAEKSAYDVQNAINSTGANLYASDAQKYAAYIASEAQKYVADLEDPYRVLDEIAKLEAAGKYTEANWLKQTFLVSGGISEEGAANIVAEDAKEPVKDNQGAEVTGIKNWTPGGYGLVQGNFSGLGYEKVNYKDLENGKDESFKYQLDGQEYALKVTGPSITATSDPQLYKALNTITGATKTSQGLVAYYNNHAYICANGVWRRITDTPSFILGSNYDAFIKALKGTK